MITLLPYGGLGSIFSIKKLLFDETLTIPNGRADEQQEAQSSNGLFSADVKALSKARFARFQYVNGVVHLVDLNSSSGTFRTKDNAITTRCTPNVPVEITEGNIIQFVKTIVRITTDLDHDATEPSRDNLNGDDVLFRHEATDADVMPILQLLPNDNYGAPFTRKTIRFQSDRTVPIGRETIDLKSRATNGIFSSDITTVSKVHARFELINDTVHLVDLMSSSGTFHRNKDGRIVKCVPNIPVPISSGDTVRFGASADIKKFIDAIIIVDIARDRIPNVKSTILTDDDKENCDDSSTMQTFKKNRMTSKRPALTKVSRCSPKRLRH